MFFLQSASEYAELICQHNCPEVSVKNCWHELKQVDLIHYQVRLEVNLYKASFLL